MRWMNKHESWKAKLNRDNIEEADMLVGIEICPRKTKNWVNVVRDTEV